AISAICSPAPMYWSTVFRIPHFLAILLQSLGFSSCSPQRSSNASVTSSTLVRDPTRFLIQAIGLWSSALFASSGPLMPKYSTEKRQGVAWYFMLTPPRTEIPCNSVDNLAFAPKRKDVAFRSLLVPITEIE